MKYLIPLHILKRYQNIIKIIHETDIANNFQAYYKKIKKKLSKEMRDAIERGLKYSAKDYAEAIDFMKQSYESYQRSI